MEILTKALTKYSSINSTDKYKEQPTQTKKKMTKSETVKSFFSIAMLQMRNGQRTDVISETAVFIKFQ